MLSKEVEDVAAEWSKSGPVRVLLQQLLDRPYDDVLGVGDVHPFSEVCILVNICQSLIIFMVCLVHLVLSTKYLRTYVGKQSNQYHPI